MSVYALFDKHVRERIEEIEELPTLPHVSQELLKLRENPDAGANELSRIIEFDPILCAQIIRFASTPIFCSRKASNIQDAVNRLGFNHALSLAIGLATGKHFSAPHSGPLGLKAFWHHAVYSASLMQHLAMLPSIQERNDTGLVYLAGLLHNIGYLLFAHQFPKEYSLLNQMVQNNQRVANLDTERAFIGAPHTEIGIWLMRKWRLPAPIVTAIYEHHNPNYKGDHAVYANLAFIADRALKAYDIGDGDSVVQDGQLLKRLGIRQVQIDEAVEKLVAEKHGIESFIQILLS